MTDPGLVNFTRNSQANGKSDVEITDILRKNGQNDEQIRLIFDAVAGFGPDKKELEAESVSGVSTDINFVKTELNPLKLKFAGFGVRLKAAIIDTIIFLLLGIVIPQYAMALLFVLYNITMLTLYGATLGKMLVGIKVISDNGEPLTLSRVLMREIIGKILSQLFFFAGYIMVAFTRNKQGLHDMIASTYVVYLRK